MRPPVVRQLEECLLMFFGIISLMLVLAGLIGL